MSSPKGITWMTVGLAESVAIVTLNLCTIIAFMRNRNPWKRSTYLVMHLAFTDMLAGAVAVYVLFYWFGVICNVWKGHVNVDLAGYIATTVLSFFPGVSLVNISIIALERVYATFRPLRHRVLKKWVYGLLIAFVWVVTYVWGSVPGSDEVHILYIRISFVLFFLFITCVSYSSIFIKVRCGAQPQHHRAARRERKLTMTLLIVTVVSLLLYLPASMFAFLVYSDKFEMSSSAGINLQCALWVLLYANSLVNPILYAIRMPQYRSAVAALFCKRPTFRERRVLDLSLRNM